MALALRARALDVCDELGVSERRARVEDIIGVAAGTREARAGAGRLLAARAAGHEYDPDRTARFDELASFLCGDPDGSRRAVRAPARWTAGVPWQDRGAVDGYLVATNALTDSTDAERSGVRLELR